MIEQVQVQVDPLQLLGLLQGKETNVLLPSCRPTIGWGGQRAPGVELLRRAEGYEEAPHRSKRQAVPAHRPSLVHVQL